MSNAQSVFQGVVRLPLIQTNIGTSLHIGIEQPVDDEQRALYAPDLALQASGCDQVHVVHKPRLLSDNGSSYVSGELE